MIKIPPQDVTILAFASAAKNPVKELERAKIYLTPIGQEVANRIIAAKKKELKDKP